MWEYNSLCHWGIFGMKWGVRRYQNADGTLTEEGRRRYSKTQDLMDKGNKSAMLINDSQRKLNHLNSLSSYYNSDGKLTTEGERATWSLNKDKALNKLDYVDGDMDKGILNEHGKWKMNNALSDNREKLRNEIEGYQDDIKAGEKASSDLSYDIRNQVIQDYKALAGTLDTGEAMLNTSAKNIRGKAARKAAKVDKMDMSNLTTQEMKERMDRYRTEMQYDEMFNTKRQEIAHGKDKQAELTEGLARGLGLASSALSVAVLWKQLKN